MWEQGEFPVLERTWSIDANGRILSVFSVGRYCDAGSWNVLASKELSAAAVRSDWKRNGGLWKVGIAIVHW